MSLPFPIVLPAQEASDRYMPYVLGAAEPACLRHALMLPRGMRTLPLRPRRQHEAWRTLHVTQDEREELTVGVRALRVEREVAPAGVLNLLLRGLGAEIVHARAIPLPGGGPTLDALTRTEEGGQSFVSRWTALKSGHDEGATFLVAEARVPAKKYAERAEDLLVATSSLSFLEPSGFPFAEKLYKHNRGTPGDFAFFRPASWEVEDDLLDEATRVVRLRTSLQGHAIGTIVLLCSSALSSRERILEPFTRALEAQGLALDLGRAQESPAFGSLERTFEQVGVARAQGEPHGLRVRAYGGVRGAAWYLVGAIGPTFETWPLASEIVGRAQDLVRSSLRTLPV